jgi:Restriction endonuclease
MGGSMSGESTFLKEFERLKRHGNAVRRGYEFQSFVGSLFKREHFTVEPRARAATPRQVDLLVTRGEEAYLIETKWRKDPANINDIDSLFTRLEAMPSSVVGIMVSYSGFTREAVNRVSQRSNRPVLLVTGGELERVLQWGGDLMRLLHRKKDRLLVHREVLLDTQTDKRRRAGRAKPGELASATAEVVFADGRRSKWLSCGGGFGQFVSSVSCLTSTGFLALVLGLRPTSRFRSGMNVGF